VSERLRHRIAELVLEKSGEDVKVTASFGGSLLRPDQPFSEALHQADLALYEAKSNGRNRVEFRRCLQLAA
jgi:PleD family two-component response regulator